MRIFPEKSQIDRIQKHMSSGVRRMAPQISKKDVDHDACV